MSTLLAVVQYACAAILLAGLGLVGVVCWRTGGRS